MTKKKKVFIFIIICIVLAGIGVGVVIFLTSEDSLKVKRLGENITTASVSDYSDSKLNLHKNGTFDIEIVYGSETIFVAVGTYVKNKDNYQFTYSDCWEFNEEMEQDPGDFYIGKTHTYEISKSQIRFVIHNREIFYLG